MNFIPRAGDVDLSASTLLIPAVSIGNVGQLALEAVLCTLSCPLVGYLVDDNVLPCAGYDPLGNDPSRVALSLELYRTRKAGLYILQQRAPVVTGRQRHFSEHLIDWARSEGCARIVIVGSIDAACSKDAQLADRRARFVSTAQQLDSWLTSAGLVALEDSELFDVKEDKRRTSPWPLMHKCREDKVVACSILAFANEGNNVQDALALATFMNTLLELGVDKGTWKLPPMFHNDACA